MIRKKFFMNVLPAMLAFAFTGIYAIVDGWFVGQNIGDNGLAAINIAYPISALIQAMASGIGMSGAIHIGISMGENEKEKEKRYLGNTLMLLIATCILLTAILLLTYPIILRAFGAKGELMEMAKIYIRIIIIGGVFQIFSTGLVPIIRNYEGAMYAMGSMMAGFVTNVVLDWLFVSVWKWGMSGAAIATIVGQAVTMIPCIFFLVWKKLLIGYADYRPKSTVLKEIFLVGISPFGLTLSPNLIIVILNKGAMVYGGVAATACYAVISYVVCVAQLLLQGVGDGAQPLISFYEGLKKRKELKQIRFMTYAFSIVLAVFCIAWMYLCRNVFPVFFGVSVSVGAEVGVVLPIFLAGLLFFAYTRVTTAYFYAIKKNKYAYLLIYGEPVLMTLLILCILGPVFGLYGVWYSVPVTQSIMAVISFVLIQIEKREHENTWFLDVES